MRTSFHHQSEAQPPNSPLTAATSPDTPSLGPTTQSTANWRFRVSGFAPMKRPGSNRQTEHRILAGPLCRSIAETHDANPPRQSSFDGGLHEIGREESERDRHIDLSNAASLPCSDLLDTRDGAGNNLIKPT